MKVEARGCYDGGAKAAWESMDAKRNEEHSRNITQSMRKRRESGGSPHLWCARSLLCAEIVPEPCRCSADCWILTRSPWGDIK